MFCQCRRSRQFLHALYQFFLGSSKCCLFRFVLETLDQLIQPFQFCLLLLVLLLPNGQILQLLLSKLGIIAHIAYKFLICQLIDNFCRFINKISVMGNHDNRARIILQIIFQPSDTLHVQMIRWLIQQQDIRFFQEQPYHSNLCLFSSGKIRQKFFFIVFCKTKASKNPVIFLLEFEALPVPGISGRAQHHHLFLHRMGSILKDLLSQHANSHISCQINALTLPAVISFQKQLPGNQPQKRCFSGTVRTGNGNAFPPLDLKIKMLQEIFTANGQCAVRNPIQHLKSPLYPAGN